jgi:hypothetical protein
MPWLFSDPALPISRSVQFGIVEQDQYVIRGNVDIYLSAHQPREPTCLYTVRSLGTSLDKASLSVLGC